MYMLDVHPHVYEELEFARMWYAERSKDLGIEFLNEIDFAMQAIQGSPEIQIVMIDSFKK